MEYGFYRTKAEFLQHENNVRMLKTIEFKHSDEAAELVIWAEPESKRVRGHLFSQSIDQPSFETVQATISYDSAEQEVAAQAAIEAKLTQAAEQLGFSPSY